jgi:hypothetical protein
VSAASWLGPPSRTRSENCNERFTGRPRPIPGDGSTRSRTRSTAGTFWSGRGSWCAPTRARPASTKQTITDVERYGVDRLLDALAVDLKGGRWRPLPARRVFIPKPGRPTERRPLSIPAVRDRVVQAATKIVIEPIFGKRRTTGMREGNERVLHRRASESRWPRVMRWRPARAQRSVHRGARRPAIEPRKGSYLGVPTRSKTSEGNTAGGVFASRQRTPRGLRTRACVRALHAENREISRSSACRDGGAGRAGKVEAVIP